MTSQRRLRLVTTNDFLCSVSPIPTSYGRLPGGDGIRRTVERLGSEGVPTIWIDCGDFSQGGPMATISRGALGFAAANELGIHASAAGNHEFDWGVEHLRHWAARLNFPLLCANSEVGLPPATLLRQGGVTLGVVGLTHPEAHLHARLAPPPDKAPAEVVPALVADLRRQGADAVVVALHDGSDWPAGGSQEFNMERYAGLCRPWISQVDAVVAGHTLGRWLGMIDGTPVAQPWAFGAELGIIELVLGDRSAARVYGVWPGQGGEWSGAGAEVLRETESFRLGRLRSPLTVEAGRPSSLADYFAEAVREASGTDGAVVAAREIAPHQPPIDGVFSWLPAGPVTEAMLLRVMPWGDDSTVQAELTGDEVRRLRAVSQPGPWSHLAVTPVIAALLGRPVTVAAGHFMAPLISEWIGREPGWKPTGSGLRAAFRSALERLE